MTSTKCIIGWSLYALQGETNQGEHIRTFFYLPISSKSLKN